MPGVWDCGSEGQYEVQGDQGAVGQVEAVFVAFAFEEHSLKAVAACQHQRGLLVDFPFEAGGGVHFVVEEAVVVVGAIVAEPASVLPVVSCEGFQIFGQGVGCLGVYGSRHEVRGRERPSVVEAPADGREGQSEQGLEIAAAIEFVGQAGQRDAGGELAVV